MPAWLDITIVIFALALASLLVRHIFRRGKACAKACGACGPGRNELVQIRRNDRPILAGSRGSR